MTAGFEAAQGPTNAALLAAALRGEAEAWDGLVSRFGRLIWAVARGFELPSQDVADLTQTVWLRLIEHADQISDPERLGSWLATITRREGIRFLRRKSMEVPELDGGELAEIFGEDLESGPEEIALLVDDYHQVRHAIAKLPRRVGEVTRLSLGGLNSREIAAMLEIAEPTVRVHLSNGRRLLRAELEEDSGYSVLPPAGRRGPAAARC